MYYENESNGFFGYFGGILLVILGFIVVVGLALTIVEIIATWKVYKKAGKAGWESIVPIYNQWVLCEITGVEKWFFALLISPIVVSIINFKYLNGLAYMAALGASFFCNYNLSIKFGKKGYGYALGLTLLPYVFYPILGFGKSQFEDVPVSKYGPISDETNTDQKTSNKVCSKCGLPIKDEIYCTNCGEKVK